MSRAFAKYLHMARTGSRQELAALPVWLGRFAFYGVILLVFSRLWHAVFEERAIGDVQLTFTKPLCRRKPIL